MTKFYALIIVIICLIKVAFFFYNSNKIKNYGIPFNENRNRIGIMRAIPADFSLNKKKDNYYNVDCNSTENCYKGKQLFIKKKFFGVVLEKEQDTFYLNDTTLSIFYDYNTKEVKCIKSADKYSQFIDYNEAKNSIEQIN